MKISDNGINLIKQFEGLSLKPYLDIVNVATIGYGSTYCICGAKITMDTKPITEEFATFMLKQNVKIYEAGVNNCVKVPLTQNQYDALVSLCYNIGVRNFTNSTLVKKLNLKDYIGAREQFKVWRLAGGKVVQGLVNRRAKESDYFLTGML
jgi:lysozyme